MTSSSPLFSIVIPTFNRADLIHQTITSVQRQTTNDFEIIIVDDGSIDNTAEIIAGIRDSRLKYIKIVNSERAVARNTGAKNAIGHYVTFLDSDDLLKPNHLSIAADFLRNHQSPEVFSLGYDVITSDHRVLHRWTRLPNPINDKLLEGNFLSCLGVFVRRDIFLQNPFNEDRALSGSEDYELWLRLAARYPIHTIPESTAYVVQHDSRSVVESNIHKLLMRRRLLNQYADENNLIKQKFGGRLNTFRSYNDLYTALHLAMMNENRLAIGYLAGALKYHMAVLFSYRFWVVVKKILLS